jgi:hypothetical protein
VPAGAPTFVGEQVMLLEEAGRAGGFDAVLVADVGLEAAVGGLETAEPTGLAHRPTSFHRAVPVRSECAWWIGVTVAWVPQRLGA